MNYSYSSGIAPTLLESYLQRRALENVPLNLGYLNDAQMIEQPKNNGKYVTFFRYTELPAVDKPLYEGVTPDGQNLEETAFSVITKNYGGWMGYTDEIDLWHVDSKTQAMSDRLNRQAQLTIDTVGRNALCAGLNVMYPSGVTARSAITRSNKISYAMIKLAVRNLKRKGAQPFADGFFHAKCDQDTYYDLTEDDNWKDANKYQDKTRESKYELGTIYNVKFFAVDNGKTFTNETYLYGSTENLLAPNVSPCYNATTRTLTVNCSTMTSDIARELAGKLVYVAYTDSTTRDTKTLMCIEKVTWDSSYAYVQFRWTPGTTVTNNWTYAKDVGILPSGGGNSVEVHATLIYGQDAFGCVKLGGKGKPNIQIIVKELGASGTDDPLNQRGTIGWKVPFFCAAILQDDFIVRLEHGCTA